MKVKVNRVRGGSMGDQRNYGLVTGSIWNYENKPDTNRVSDTLSPVPRDKANIEAERGETIVGDLDRDGMVEHAIVGGKRHFQGGTPLNVPDGSFVFSDYTKLKIRNKELLKGIFNYSASKGVTPATIAKRYELNKYKDILNDPESDALDRKTAQLMLDNNMKKLGQLALVQEGMKGFPDGIPDIARPLLGTDLAQVTPSQQTPMMKKGGLVKAQGGKEQNIYENSMQQFNQWKQNWLNALKQNDVQKIKKLKVEGEKLSKTLNEMEVPWSIPFNTSWLFSDPREVSWGTQEGKLHDAADVIDNYLNFYEESGKRAQRAAEAYKNRYTAKKESQSLFNAANAIIKDYQTKGGASAYSEKDIANAYAILEKFKPTEYYPEDTENPFFSDRVPTEAVTWNPLTDFSLKGITDLKKSYPLSSINVASSETPIPAGQETVTGFGLPAVNADVVTDVPFAPATGTSTPPVKQVDTTTGLVIKPTITRQQLIDEYLKQYPNATQAELDSYVELQGFKQGGTLLKAQNGITFDIADENLEEQIRRINEANADADYEYYIERPSYTPATKIALGQGQAASAKMKSKEDPTTGFLIPEKGVKFDQKEFEKFYSDLYGNYTSPSGGTGYAAWAKDYANPATRAAAGAYRTKAINQQPLLLELEQQLKKIDPKASISQIIKPDVLNAAGVNVSDLMGIEQLTAPMIRKRQRVKPQQPAAPAAGPKTEMEGIKPPSYTGAGYYSPWTDYSLVDYYTALGNAAGVNRGMLPPFATYNPQMFEPTFLDPTRSIDQQKGLTAQTQQEIGAISDPQIAVANQIAAAAKAAPQVANIMADYDNRNVGIANQAAMANIAAANDARLKNIGLTDKFMERLTTREQQYENAMRDARTKVADSYKRGAVDAREWAAMNQANPNYYYDQFGNIRFRPGFNPTKDPSGSSNMLASTAKSIKDAFPSVNDDRAAELAIALMRSRSRNGVSNPMDNIWNQ